jgi:ankyrin repeat protein
VSRKRRWEIGATAALLLAVAVAVGGFFYWRERQRRLDRELVSLLSGHHLPGFGGILVFTPGERARVLSLLRQGASVHTRDRGRRTVLFHAATGDDLPLLTEALSRGADPNAADEQGLTPLMWAADRGHSASVRGLLEHGADVNREDHHGCTALSLARTTPDPALYRRALDTAKQKENQALIHLLKQHGAKE